MARKSQPLDSFDRELVDLPAELRWREWMGRVEAVIFAAPNPVSREILGLVVGRECNVDLLIDDIREELRGRPYELVSVAGGWQHRTKASYGIAIRAAAGVEEKQIELSPLEMTVLAAIAYTQPVTRSNLGSMFGKEVGRDLIARLRSKTLIAAGPRSPQPGTPYTYVTTPEFLSHFGLETLGDLPDLEIMEDAGLLKAPAPESEPVSTMPIVREEDAA